MAGKGGYQRPTSPAPVSGPGSLSQRTDGGPAHKQAAKYISGLPYGQGQEMMNTQSSAPMEASTPTPNPVPASQIAAAGQQEQPVAPMPVIPLNAPTQRPDEPVTSGANLGPGPDMASMGLSSPTVAQHQSASSFIQNLASSTDASPALQFLAQRINGAF
jgi:hypothetical protein